MGDYYGISLSEVCRRGLTVQYSDMLREKFGYKGETVAKAKLSKEQRERERDMRIAFIKTGDPEEITAWLNEIQYFENVPEGARAAFAIKADTGTRVVQMQYFKDGQLDYASDLQSEDELIRQLVKEKKI